MPPLLCVKERYFRARETSENLRFFLCLCYCFCVKDCGIFGPGKPQKIGQATFELWQISEAGMMIIMALDTWYYTN